MPESTGPGWRPDELRRTIDDTLATAASVGTPPTWTLSDDEVGHSHARAVLLLLLALPGSVLLDEAVASDSMLAYHRSALSTGRTLAAAMAQSVTWLGGPDGVLAFSRGNFACTLNLSEEPVPAIGPVLLSSAPVANGVVPPGTAVWTLGLPGADQAAQPTVALNS